MAGRPTHANCSFATDVPSTSTRTRRLLAVSVALLTPLLLAASASAAPPQSEDQQPELKRRYFLNHTDATRFCPPIRTTFVDAETTVRQVGSRTVLQQPGGGYGLPSQVARGRVAYHTGADIGWFRAGETVHAIADGVVRISQPALRARTAGQDQRGRGPAPMDFGNLIVIEHRRPAGATFFSLYGHLGDDRLVSAGDLVMAGQQIGTIGRKGAAINGGYDPHLHFGVRDGQWLATGQTLVTLHLDGRPTDVRLVEPGELSAKVAIETQTPAPVRIRMPNGDEVLADEEHGGGWSLPAWLLYSAPHATRFSGYSSSLDGWHDPIQFLRDHGAAGSPPPYYFVSPSTATPDRRRNVLATAAPEWTVDEWIRPVGGSGFKVGEFRGKVVALFCVDAACQGSLTHGIAALQEVAQHFRADPEVVVVGLHAATAGNRRNNVAAARQLAGQLPAVQQLGYCSSAGAARTLFQDYQMCGTPWVVLIDRNGAVQLSNYVIRPEELIRRVEELTTADDSHVNVPGPGQE